MSGGTEALRPALAAALDRICALTGSATAGFAAMGASGGAPGPVAWVPAEGADATAAGAAATAAAATGQPVLSTAGPCRMVAVPVLCDGRFAAVAVAAGKPGPYDDRDVAVIETVAGMAWELDGLRRAEHRHHALRALNAITALPPGDSAGQFARALELGARHLELPFGIISRIEGDTYTILHHSAPADAGLRDGQDFALGDTFCAITLQADDVVAIAHMERSPHAGHPCYAAFRLEAYIGAPVVVRGRRFGTVNFSAPTPHPRGFDEGAAEFVRLMATWIGVMLERDLAEAEIRAGREAAEAARERGALLLASVADGICGIDADGRVTFVNPAALAMLDRAEGEVLGHPVHAAICGGDGRSPHGDCPIVATLADGRPRQVTCDSIHRRDGAAVTVELSVTPMAPDRGGRTGVVMVFRDITRRQAMEEELRRSNVELEQFAYAASHDLRHPLRVIVSYLSLIEGDLAGLLTDETREFMGFVRGAARRMDRLIVDLLDYSRIGRRTAGPQPVELAGVVAEALRVLESVVADAGAVVTVAAGLPTVTGHGTELERLFQNLIGNAVKYRSPDRPPRIAVGCRRVAGGWELSVRDNGIGIPEDQRERVFGIFQRLHTVDEYEGTGIGLAVCRKIVEHHGGRIWVESGGGEGCEVRFTLPG